MEGKQLHILVQEKLKIGKARQVDGIQGGQGSAERTNPWPRWDNVGIKDSNAIPMWKAWFHNDTQTRKVIQQGVIMKKKRVSVQFCFFLFLF